MEWDEEMVTPEEWMCKVMCMVPKKKGHRTVATLASGYRVYTSLEAEEDRRWTIDHSHEDDSCKPNMSCPRAAEERLMVQGILVMDNYKTLVILWGFAKFYDTIRCDVLLLECKEEGDRRQPRWWHAKDFSTAVGRAIPSVGRGIVAGCKEASPWQAATPTGSML